MAGSNAFAAGPPGHLRPSFRHSSFDERVANRGERNRRPLSAFVTFSRLEFRVAPIEASTSSFDLGSLGGEKAPLIDLFRTHPAIFNDVYILASTAEAAKSAKLRLACEACPIILDGHDAAFN